MTDSYLATLSRLDNQDKQWSFRRSLIIGSSNDSDCVIEDDSLSAHHCLIEKRGSHYFIKDLQTQKGTYLNEVRIMNAFLKTGDIIRVDSYEFFFIEPGQQNAISVPFLKSKNKEWQAQLSKLPQMSQSDFSVLILGETGCGKEVLAKSIHQLSKRNRGPMITLNCGSLSESLIESELFGHKKGSFTGAVTDRKGAFEEAREGTLFLDEIGELPLHLQPKLLRALENQEIKPLGADRSIQTNIRVIAATHPSLKEKVASGQFRMDLYHRLNILNLTPPTLRQRMEDFETLTYRFAKEFRVRFSFNAIEKMKNYSWPGNIRELKNIVMRASALYRGELVTENHLATLLPQPMTNQSFSTRNIDSEFQLKCENSPIPIRKNSVVKDIEKELIIQRLEMYSGNQKKTALDLGIPKSTLHDRIKSYKIDVTRYKGPRRLLASGF